MRVVHIGRDKGFGGFFAGEAIEEHTGETVRLVIVAMSAGSAAQLAQLMGYKLVRMS